MDFERFKDTPKDSAKDSASQDEKIASALWLHAVGVALISVIGVISLIGVLSNWPPALSMKLSGTTQLVYEVTGNHEYSQDSSDVEANVTPELLTALHRRIDPTRTREITVREIDSKHVEILVPKDDLPFVEMTKHVVEMEGFLQFLIVANQRDHARAIDLAKELASNEKTRQATHVTSDSGERLAVWSRVAKDPGTNNWKLSVANSVVRNAETGELIKVADEHLYDDIQQFSRYMEELGVQQVDVLMATDDGFDVTGQHLGLVTQGVDEQLRSCIVFDLSGEGIGLFAGLTEYFGPEGNYQRQLGIVLDNTVLTAPNIQEPITQGRGRITGIFSYEEVQMIVNVLTAGALPAQLSDQPMMEQLVPPDQRTVYWVKGTLVVAVVTAVAICLTLVLRYRLFGCVGILAISNHAAMMLIVPVALATVTLSSVAAVASVWVAFTTLNAFSCKAVATKSNCLSSLMKGFVATAIIIVGSLLGYALGDFAIRNAAFAVFFVGLTALFVHLCVWVIPAAISRTPRPSARRAE